MKVEDLKLVSSCANVEKENNTKLVRVAFQ